MTGFEIAIPLIAFAVVGLGIVLLKRETRRIDGWLDSKRPSHPAE
ncbi:MULTISPECIES: hypothetical protein [Ponticoccus]|uniref:NADH-quinone oxidoreductase subunit H n=1 Tax=Ponticoccus litoralis TaxID=422297 RepID=A0AAW9SQ19_9RHOB|nr:hypothetical protein [Ponticoccus alexandrii]